jgi:subtilase family serine protease
VKDIISGFFVSFLSIVILAGSAMSLSASPSPALSPRIIDNRNTVVLHGNVHPLARPEYDQGPTASSLPMERMILTLRLSDARQAELDSLLTELHDPASPNYHHWLSPGEFGAQFGPSSEDIDAITGWLVSSGFAVDEVAKGRLWINFSGSVADVDRAFHTEIHDYQVKGRLYHANDKDPSIPQGLSDLVAGVVSLHNFPLKMMNTGAHPIQPDYTDSNGNHWLSPGDFAIIYNLNALYSAGIDGSGQSIAIVGRTHPSTASSDWATFRSMMGLPPNAPQIIVNGTDPGDLGGGEDTEADLDVEWSGAVAKNASILFVTSQTTGSTDGVTLSAQHIVDNNLAPVMSTSFGECEQDLGSSENTFYNNLWQQAAGQGITSFVSSADSGAAGCDSPSESTATGGLAVNGLASTPYNVAVGGTEFNEGSGNYWYTGNSSTDVSVISYISEVAWNQSGNVAGGSDLWSTGGGASSIYGKPTWQVAPGVPTGFRGNHRYVPDVALSAATHDAYVIEQDGNLAYVGGTSASSPSFAGLMALVVQDTGKPQGNANTYLYQIGNAQYSSGGATVFHDITSGNNSVPGVTGYTCGAGYSPVTGLGSVDANALVNAMQALTGTFGLTVTSTGPGGGTVTSNVGGINCGATCFAPYTSGTLVNLTAAANSGSTFTGWSGACTGTTCSVTMSGARVVTANFALPPGAPTIVSVTAGDGQAIVYFTDTASNGSAITSYTVTSSPGNFSATGTTSPITVTGLQDGTAYTFTVTATNAAGTSSASASSGSVTPAAPVPALGPWGFMAVAIGLGGYLAHRRRHG